MSAVRPSIASRGKNENKRFSRWLGTTGGIVLMLLFVQFASGLLLTFYYVPSVDHAHTTVSFIEKVLSSGSWIRSLHHYGSQWLTFFVFVHLIRLLSNEAYESAKVQWIGAGVLLALVMSAGATGYSLPWDARAFYSTRVAEGLVAGLPLIGRIARLWLLGGSEISTITLSRFFALHVLVTPFLILCVIGWLLMRQTSGKVHLAAFNRSAIVVGVVFVALALWTLKFRAPLGPSVADVTADYLPRPGGQFLWLYQTLKYVPGSLGSLVGVVVPALLLFVLILLPWLNLPILRLPFAKPQRVTATGIICVTVIWVAIMTSSSVISDRRDPRTRQQLTKQSLEEQAFRNVPFRPATLKMTDMGNDENAAPQAYKQNCVVCHGEHGEGVSRGSLKFPPLIGVGSKPRRTPDDIVGLLNDPLAYGLQPPMRSFATKLTDQEKREIAAWVVKLK
jgi:ubiquinol-cytochrome c reductase cytochrome b subunit